MTIAEQLAALNNNLDTMHTEVIAQTGLISQIKSLVTSAPEQLKDLTDTYWMFNEDIELPDGFSYSVNFESYYSFSNGLGVAINTFKRMYVMKHTNADIYNLFYDYASHTGSVSSFYYLSSTKPYWHSGCRVVKFTGGADIANKEFVEWVCRNARPLIMDLTNTTWVWSSMLMTQMAIFNVNINFTSNNKSYTYLGYNYIEAGDDSSNDEYHLTYGGTTVYNSESVNTWSNESYRTISFGSGQGAAILNFIIFLACAATLVSDGSEVAVAETESEEEASATLKSNTSLLREVVTLLGNGASIGASAHHVKGVDALPDIAADGSIALVEVTHHLLGTWYFNDTVNMGYSNWSIDFTSNGTACTHLACYGSLSYTTGDGTITAYHNGAWTDPVYRYINITGYETASFETWLSQNAVQTEPGIAYDVYVMSDGNWVYVDTYLGNSVTYPYAEDYKF